MDVIDLGSFPYGSNPVLTLIFKATDTQTGVLTPADPGAAKLKMKPPGGVSTDYSASLTHVTAGTYTFSGVDTTLHGAWTGRGYAPPGTGWASIDFEFQIQPSENP